MVMTPKQVKKAFADSGLTVSGWAKQKGFSQALVYQVLSGKRQPVRGESHRIAVALGLKVGSSATYDELNKQFEKEVMNMR
jgi:gp16 family phage-associated protein